RVRAVVGLGGELCGVGVPFIGPDLAPPATCALSLRDALPICIAVIVSNGRIVHRADGESHPGDGGVGGRVLSHVGKTVGAVVVGGGGVSDAATVAERDRAVSRTRDEHGGEGVTVDVAIIGQHA